MEEKRIEISALLRPSHKKWDIAKILNVSRISVHRVASRLRDGETLKDRPRTGRPRVVKTETIRKAFENDSTLKITRLAKKKKISVSTVRRAVKVEKGKSLKCVKKPLLTAAMKQKHLQRGNRLLNDLKNHWNLIVIFSNEKTFTVDPVVNKQNDRISELRKESTTKHPASVMMLGVVASNGEKMPPVLFPRSYRLNADAYKNVLVTKILPRVRKITRNANYVFQQDDAPAYIAKIVQEWLGQT